MKCASDARAANSIHPGLQDSHDQRITGFQAKNNGGCSLLCLWPKASCNRAQAQTGSFTGTGADEPVPRQFSSYLEGKLFAELSW